MKDTRSAVTRRLNSQAARKKKALNLTDARVVVEWLNAAKKAKAIGYERVVSIRRQLDALRALCIKLTQYDRRKLKELGREVRFPADRKTSRQAKRLHSLVNEKLSRYAHRPCVTYFVAGGVWRGETVPIDNARWFETKIGQSTVNEADAVLRLVRLDLMGELSKVRLCENCQARWRVAAKSNYKYCSPECRERFYERDPGYHPKKAATQREYRKRLKLRDALAKVQARKG